VRDRPWALDDPPSARWFEHAWEIGWTHDPFDRLLVAHARLRRWRLATADPRLLERLPERERVEI
jgi:PIN domain nuclease of toxin-antitoxin system